MLPTQQTAAFSTRMWRLVCSLENLEQKAEMLARSEISTYKAEALPGYPLALISAANAWPAYNRRIARTTCAPCFTRASDTTEPKEPVAPVTMAVCPDKSLASSSVGT